MVALITISKCHWSDWLNTLGYMTSIISIWECFKIYSGFQLSLLQRRASMHFVVNYSAKQMQRRQNFEIRGTNIQYIIYVRFFLRICIHLQSCQTSVTARPLCSFIIFLQTNFYIHSVIINGKRSNSVLKRNLKC